MKTNIINSSEVSRLSVAIQVHSFSLILVVKRLTTLDDRKAG
ncbi:hypothetical protein DDI_2234 [Dickeya dianthicola RNS04.9]|nr:hypothetical protein DDI_2234 [Dickeya dianthicola RNS04.9]